jgi:hypothetical protein
LSSYEKLVRGDCSPSRSVVSKIRASSISEVLSSVPWKNSTRRAGRRNLVVAFHGYLTLFTDAT